MFLVALVALIGMLVGLVALIRGRMVRLGVRNRKTAAALLVVCIVVFALSLPPSDPESQPGPDQDVGQTAAPEDAPVGEETFEPDPEGAEAPEGEGKKEEPDAEVEVSEPPAAGEEEPDGELAVHFIDVGQGDAILIEAPGGAALIDGGTRQAGEIVVQYLVRRGIRRIDLVVATHPHADHIGGLIDVLRNFEVHQVVDSGQPHTTATFDDYLTEVEKQVDAGSCVYEIPEGQVVDLGSGAAVTVLGPDSVAESLNDGSVVCRLDFGSTSFLFTGDAEHTAEERLLNRGSDLEADVLKVGHHGSATSTSPAFLTAVSPAHAVICVGDDNSYGHPHRETLDRLAEAGTRIYRTDVHGTVIFVSDGRELKVNAEPWTGPAQVEEEPDPGEDEGERFVGSVKSDVYHYPDCRHAESISPANLRWFDSVEQARQAGYRPCAACRPPGGE
ncbi:MAG: MBL fold metallo-hydrolase [Bacillota bacterium]